MGIKHSVVGYLFGNTSLERIHYTNAPPKTPAPYAVITLVSDVRMDTHEGDDGLVEARIQLDVYEHTDTEIEALFTEIRLAMKAFVGVRYGVAVSRCHLEGDFDAYENELGFHHKVIDYLIQYEE